MGFLWDAHAAALPISSFQESIPASLPLFLRHRIRPQDGFSPRWEKVIPCPGQLRTAGEGTEQEGT